MSRKSLNWQTVGAAKTNACKGHSWVWEQEREAGGSADGTAQGADSIVIEKYLCWLLAENKIVLPLAMLESRNWTSLCPAPPSVPRSSFVSQESWSCAYRKQWHYPIDSSTHKPLVTLHNSGRIDAQRTHQSRTSRQKTAPAALTYLIFISDLCSAPPSGAQFQFLLIWSIFEPNIEMFF